MMRAALWFLALFGAAAAVALYAGNSQGMVTLFWPPWRVDLSLNMVLLLLFGSFTLLYGALRGLAALREMPRQARRWRLQRKERAMHAALLDTLSLLLAGRFVRARKAAQLALAQEQSLADAGAALPHARQLRTLAHLLTAESAHALQDPQARTEALQQALALLPEDASGSALDLRGGAQLRAARWALDERDADAARELLAQLPQGTARRTLALRARLKAARQSGHTEEALETARLLAKHGAFTPGVAHSLVRALALEWLHEARDPTRLGQIWQQLEPAERAQPELALAAAQQHIDLGGARADTLAWLEPVWRRFADPAEKPLPEHLGLKLVHALEACAAGQDPAWLARIEAAHQARPKDAPLTYLAGVACVERQLWGKAEQLLTQAAQHLQDAPLRAAAWRHLAALAEQRSDTAAAAQAWKRAALVR